MSPWFVAPSALAAEATLALLEQLATALSAIDVVSSMDSLIISLRGRFTPFSDSIVDK